MVQENGNEDKIINISFFPKYFDWFTVQSKSFNLLSKVISIDLVDLENVTQAARVIRGPDNTAVKRIAHVRTSLPNWRPNEIKSTA